jgi:hypothetical protein
MFDSSNLDWTDEAVAVTAPRIAVVFSTQDNFYTGDPNNFEQIESGNHRIPLPAPSSIAKLPYQPTSEDIAGNEQLLVEHYRALIKHTQKTGSPFTRYSHYFWMRLSILWEDGGTTLPWYDTWSEMDRLLQWIETAHDSDEWSDMDQGWEIQFARLGDNIFMREGDGDGEVYHMVKLDRNDLMASIGLQREFTTSIIAILRQNLGADAWTRHHYGQEIRFRKVNAGKKKRSAVGLENCILDAD